MIADASDERNVLAGLDMDRRLNKGAYKVQLAEQQARLNQLFRAVRASGRSMILVFEGWDAGGKGGTIRRLTSALDARDYPTIFDRSWYGRVLVERIEGFASEDEWQRAFVEISDFENQLSEHGTILVKFWMHITPDEQEARFRDRESTPHKRWKLCEEDLRNRSRWPQYEEAVDEMVRRTSTPQCPWYLVEANDKRYARVDVLRRICARLEHALGHVVP